MRPLVLYHKNCADGFGAAFAAWLSLGETADYMPIKHGDEPSCFDTELIRGRDVYILDFGFPRGIMNIILEQATCVVWLDHHKTAFEQQGYAYERTARYEDSFLPKYYILLDDSKSGAMLSWEYFHPELPAPMIIRHIDDGDRWQFKFDGTRGFYQALWSYAPWDFDQWRQWYRDFTPSQGGSTTALKAFINEGNIIIRSNDQVMNTVLTSAVRNCHIHDASVDLGRDCQLIGLATNCTSNLASEIGHELANISGTYGLCWYLNKKGTCSCSIRSNGDYDVSAIAKAFGGGGHMNAAGFEIDVHTLLGWLYD